MYFRVKVWFIILPLRAKVWRLKVYIWVMDRLYYLYCGKKLWLDD